MNTPIKLYKTWVMEQEQPVKKKRGKGYTKPLLCKKAKKKRMRRTKDNVV